MRGDTPGHPEHPRPDHPGHHTHQPDSTSHPGPHPGPHPLPNPSGDAHALAHALCPVLRHHLGDRLSEVRWFHASWQNGGAATGAATFTPDHGHPPREVIVKLPVGPDELAWTRGLGHTPDWSSPNARALPVPRVVAAGDTLGGYDLGWLVVERLSGPPLAHKITPQEVLGVLTAAADFQHAAAHLRPSIQGPTPRPAWERAIDHSREVSKSGDLADGPRWNDWLRRVHRALPILLGKWERRHLNAWCHGDLHPGNVLRRPPPPDHPHASPRCVLIDLALVHAGHWLEDALYFERQYWGHTELLGGIKPVPTLARLRRERGLEADDNYGELAGVRRVLMAACAPANIERVHNAKYLAACLDTIEQYLPQVGH